MPRVLIVVLNYNKKQLVLECLDSLIRHPYANARVVIVDNASSDGSVDAVRNAFPQLQCLANATNLGAAGGRNAGVRFAGGAREFDYILFLDDDAEVAGHAIGRLVEALEDQPKAGLACGKTYTRFDGRQLMSTGICVHFHRAFCFDRGAAQMDEGQYDENGWVDACGAFAFMIRADLFSRLGGFDEIFSPYGWEDVDICLRARELGFGTRYVHNALFAHKGTRLGRAPVAAYERLKVKNYMILMARHMTASQKLAALIFVPLRGLNLLFQFARRGQWRALGAQFGAVKDLLVKPFRRS